MSLRNPSKFLNDQKHICNTKSSTTLLHNYFSIYNDELSSNENYLSTNEIVQKNSKVINI